MIVPTIEAWVAQDVQVLLQMRVLENAAALAQSNTATSVLLDEAWQRYTSTSHDHVVGRGLYAIQLRHWYAALDSQSKRSDDLLVVSSTDFLQQRRATYRKMLLHFNLPYEEPHPDNAHVQDYHSSMSPHLQRLLQDLYRPFDYQLRTVVLVNQSSWVGWDYEFEGEGKL